MEVKARSDWSDQAVVELKYRTAYLCSDGGVESPVRREMAEVERQLRGAVEVLRINRPEVRNALNTAMLTGIGVGIQLADADPDVLAVIVTGSGDTAFCRDGPSALHRRGKRSPQCGGAGGSGRLYGLHTLRLREASHRRRPTAAPSPAASCSS